MGIVNVEMKIQLLPIKNDDVFIFVDGKLRTRTDAGADLFKALSDITGNEIILEEFPHDTLYQLVEDSQAISARNQK